MMEFVGRLHPLIVHLPIGILLLGLVMLWWSRFSSGKRFLPVLEPVLFFGTIAAVISVITGLVMANNGDYDVDSVNRHRNTGIALAVLSLLLWILVRRGRLGLPTIYLSLSVFLGLISTGHYGATLTHGEDFLFRSDGDQSRMIKPLPDPQQALVYAEIIDPILQQKCVSCHGNSKQKGKLRLDSEDWIRKGGKNGPVVGEPGQEAEMLLRILLPPDDEEHMPPKEKGQLSKQQVALISWWIRTGADFKARANALLQSDTIRAALAALKTATTDEQPPAASAALPEVEAAPAASVEALKKAGAAVIPLQEGSNWLSVNLINVTDTTETVWRSLLGLKEQVWQLKAEDIDIPSASFNVIAQLKGLRQLSLADARIEAADLKALSALPELHSLNLKGTSVDLDALRSISSLPKLENLYLFNTAIDSTRIGAARALFPKAKVEAGRYFVPTLVSDTSLVK